MSWRTVVIRNRCKLDLKMGYMVVRGEETKRVFLDEISILIIENTAVSVTGCLLSALAEKKIKVIFCDGKRNPYSELVPLYGSHDTSAKIRAQIQWDDSIKGAVWTEIVSEKVRKQAEFLLELGCKSESELLASYVDNIEYNDATNREGHAAKVYFNALFGKEFTRTGENVTNAALDYGYALLLSAFNRAVTTNGYLTQLGLFHDNMFNYFNLSSDLMEPFRILVDRCVKENDFKVFEKNEKLMLVDMLNSSVHVDGTNQTVINAIKMYVKSVFEALNSGDLSDILFYKNI